ncbi:MAG: hypothetical protein ACLRLD_03825 [Lachnospira sp.]
MMDKENRDIVDSQGNVLKSTKKNKIKEFLKNNIWNLLGTGLATCITLVGIMNLLISKNYCSSCAAFYGINRKYFSGTEMFEDKMIFAICALVLLAYPFSFSYITKKLNSKVSTVVAFLLTIFILFIQNVLYTSELLYSIPWGWMKKYIDNYVVIGIFLLSDILIAYFIIIREFFFERKKYKIFEKVIFTIALLIYLISTTVGISLKINYDISDKKAYEVIENNKVIISDYDGKFVVMGCEIQGETIILKKGTCSLEEMTGVSITYHKYDQVICE